MNQSISISFDPNTLVCISCATEHKIMGNTPVTIAFSDQNFVASIVGKEGTCFGVVRMEDASLSDLTELSLEILGNVRVPEGSVLLFGSASFLSRVGTGAYATDWVSVVSQIEKKWRGIRVCPLIPMILTECPGTLAREIAEIAAWFATIYENNPLGLYSMWASVVAATESLSVGAIALPHMDSYKISVPLSLTLPCQFSSMTFCSVSSRPATLSGLPKDNLCVLVQSLVDTVHRSFHSCASPENYLERETPTVPMDTCEEKVILLGASNLGRCAARLRALGNTVVDLTKPGWIATKANVDTMLGELDKISCNEKTILVYDLYGNSTFRFEQFDGSLSMPFNSSGKYHLAGNIVVCPMQVFRKIFENTSALLARHKTVRSIIIPPLPRYLFTGCCTKPEHSTNINNTGYCIKLLTDTINIRNNLKKLVSELGIRGHVLDSCCVTSCPTTANTLTRIEALKTVCAPDGVHFLSAGYENLVAAITSAPIRMPVTSSANTCTAKIYYWRGFRSAVGSRAVPTLNRGSFRGGHSAKNARGHRNPHFFHPYRRGK